MPLHYLLLYSVIVTVCKCVWLNVSRGAQNGNDMFTNLDTTATCPRTSDKGASWCKSRLGLCSNQGCCVCVCNWSFSTFQVDLQTAASRCVGNQAIRTFAGCNQYRFASVGPVNPLLTFDFSRSGVKGIEIPGLFSKAKCKLKDVKYLSQKNWNDLPSEGAKSFSMGVSKSWPYFKLEWTGQLPSTYFGHILKVNAECKQGKDKRTFCVVFKAKGSLTYDVQIPTSQPDTTTVTSTAAASDTETTMAATRRITSVPRTQRYTFRTDTSTPLSTKVVATQTTARTAVEPTTENDSTTGGESSTTGAQTTLPEDISTIAKQTNSGNKAPKKDGKIEGGKISDAMIIISVGVAVAIFVAVISLSAWLVCQRRKRKGAANSDPTITVLRNPTAVRSQDHLPMPGLLRNPVYAEPQQRVRVSDVVDIGTQKAGSNLLLENPGASSGRSSPRQENSYNNMERKCARGRGAEFEQEKSLYQGLVGQEAQRFAAATNVSLYQSLKPDVVLYQPLRKNITLDESPDEGPKYLRLLNPDESIPHSSPSPPNYQPPYSMGPPPMDVDEPPEYADYADLDELEERATNGAHKMTPGQAACHSPPSYGGLEGPYSELYHAPAYEVLEGPNSTSVISPGSGQEAPVFGVLEGPAVDNATDYLELL